MTATTRLTSTVLAAASLLTLLACGGGGGGSSAPTPTPTAHTLAYTDPTASGWKLVKNTGSSTATHLVLDLVGPSGQSGYGVGFTLSADQTKTTWTKVASADPELVKNQLYTLGSGSKLYKAGVSGNNLMAGVFHKGTGGAATSYTGPLVSVALDLKSGLAPNTAIPVTVAASQELQAGGMSNITVAVGTLVAQ